MSLEDLLTKSNKPSIKENNMSIETDLNRIATSLEEIVKHLKSNVVALGTPGRTESTKPLAEKPVKEKAVPVPVPVIDPITGDQAKTYTQDELHAVLQNYMEKNGVEGVNGVKALMIKHGANKVKPTITSIPLANYGALVAEVSK
jgi:hypothetical protein